jgi:hypothetical protein
VEIASETAEKMKDIFCKVAANTELSKIKKYVSRHKKSYFLNERLQFCPVVTNEMYRLKALEIPEIIGILAKLGSGSF